MPRKRSAQPPLQVNDMTSAEHMEALQTENRRLHAQIVKLEVQHISDEARIVELEKALKEAIEKPGLQIVMHLDTPDTTL